MYVSALIMVPLTVTPWLIQQDLTLLPDFRRKQLVNSTALDVISLCYKKTATKDWLMLTCKQHPIPW